MKKTELIYIDIIMNKYATVLHLNTNGFTKIYLGIYIWDTKRMAHVHYKACHLIGETC